MKAEVLYLVFIILILGRTAQGGSGTHTVTAYWGHNSIGRLSPWLLQGSVIAETSLDVVCDYGTHLDTLIIGFLDSFKGKRNIDGLPGLDLSRHCTKAIDNNHLDILSCPELGHAITRCQKQGLKVLISIGGPSKHWDMADSTKAEALAQNVWDLFLGGRDLEQYRPFGNVVLDGVDLFIQSGHSTPWQFFVRYLHSLFVTDRTRLYRITTTVQCAFPDRVMGPSPLTLLSEAGRFISRINVRMYVDVEQSNLASVCGWSTPSAFQRSVESWINYCARLRRRFGMGPKVTLVLPASEQASSYSKDYIPAHMLHGLLQSLQTSDLFSGIGVWDISWDINNVYNGLSYSERVSQVFRREEEHVSEWNHEHEWRMPDFPGDQEHSTCSTSGIGCDHAGSASNQNSISNNQNNHVLINNPTSAPDVLTVPQTTTGSAELVEATLAPPSELTTVSPIPAGDYASTTTSPPWNIDSEKDVWKFKIPPAVPDQLITRKLKLLPVKKDNTASLTNVTHETTKNASLAVPQRGGVTVLPQTTSQPTGNGTVAV